MAGRTPGRPLWGELMLVAWAGLGSNWGCLLPLFGVMGTGCWDVTGCSLVACELAVRPCIETFGWICI